MFLYNEGYMNTYKRFRDIMDTDIVIVLNKTTTQVEDPIFKIKALTKTRKFIEDDKEVLTSEIVLFISELEELMSINLAQTAKFPVRDIVNRVKLVRFNNMTYTIDSKSINYFNNILKFSLISSIGG